MLPNEFDALLPLMAEFYEGIRFKEALENPIPFLHQMKRECFESPYVMVYACFSYELEPLGYIWFALDIDRLGKHFTKIEQVVVAKEKRNTRIGVNLIKFAVQLGYRHNAQYCKIEASTKDSAKMWERYGFKPRYMTMQFEGGAIEFGKQNPIFQLDFCEDKANGKQIEPIIKAVP